MFIDISRKDSKLMPGKQRRASTQGGPAQTHESQLSLTQHFDYVHRMYVGNKMG